MKFNLLVLAIVCTASFALAQTMGNPPPNQPPPGSEKTMEPPPGQNNAKTQPPPKVDCGKMVNDFKTKGNSCVSKGDGSRGQCFQELQAMGEGAKMESCKPQLDQAKNTIMMKEKEKHPNHPMMNE